MSWFEIFWWIPTWLWIISLMIGLLYYYGNQPYSMFRKLGIPGPKPDMFFGNSKQMLKEGMISQLQKWGEEYGHVFGIYFGKLPKLVITDLDILKEIFVKDFQHFTDREEFPTGNKIISKGLFFQNGEDWKRIRHTLTPTFSSGKLKLMFSSIQNCGQLLAKRFELKAGKGETSDVKSDYGAYTIDVIARTAFGLDIDSQTNPNEPFITFSRKLLNPSNITTSILLLTSSFPILTRVLQYFSFGLFPNEPVEFIINATKSILRERKAESNSSDVKRADFLQLLLNAEITEENGDTSSNGFHDKVVKRLSGDEVLGQAFLFLIAGYETTATTLQYLSYNLAKYPEVQDKIIKEINTKIGDRDATYDDLSKMTYLEHVIQETLRMYPPVVYIERVTSEEVKIKGITIPKNCAVLIPIYSIHHDSQIYENPEEFIPERFANKEFNPVAFLPFGYGPRTCIGLRLAMAEIKVAMISSLQKVRYVKHEKTIDKIEFCNLLILKPKEPIVIGVKFKGQS